MQLRAYVRRTHVCRGARYKNATKKDGIADIIWAPRSLALVTRPFGAPSWKGAEWLARHWRGARGELWVCIEGGTHTTFQPDAGFQTWLSA